MADAKAKAPAKPKGKPTRVRAVRAHTQPDTLQYRSEGEEFVHHGDLYDHVEAAPGKVEEEEGDEE